MMRQNNSRRINLDKEIKEAQARLAKVLPDIIKKRPPIDDKKLLENVEEFLNILAPWWREDNDLKETPNRYSKAMTYLTSGYDTEDEDINKIVTLFARSCRLADESCHNLITFGGTFKTLCAHHILNFNGRFVISYIPKNLRLGASKFQRVVNIVMRTLQSQEDLVHDISDILEAILDPSGIAVWTGGEHQCMQVRGVEAETSWMEVDIVRGEFLNNPMTRQDWNSLLIERAK